MSALRFAFVATFALALLSAPAGAAPVAGFAPSPWPSLAGDERALRALVAESQALPLPARIEIFTRYFLGRPYVLGPLGEGAEGRYDQDPMFRFDVFDCTTYVETVLALSAVTSFDEYANRVLRIRYLDGLVDYTWRNHFPELDWIPNNERAGHLRDVTEAVSGDQPASLARAHVDKPRWYSKKKPEAVNVPGLDAAGREQRLRELQAEGRRFQAVDVITPYIPFTALMTPRGQARDEALLARIPSGAVINIVRPGWDLVDSAGTQLNISHQGIVIRKGAELFLRHASAAAPLQVVEVPLLEYLARYLSSPTAKGINLLQPL